MIALLKLADGYSAPRDGRYRSDQGDPEARKVKQHRRFPLYAVD